MAEPLPWSKWSDRVSGKTYQVVTRSLPADGSGEELVVFRALSDGKTRHMPVGKFLGRFGLLDAGVH